MRPAFLRLLIPALLAGLVISGCTKPDSAANRLPGDTITLDEATVLANVLPLNLAKGGAKVKVVAPFAETATLTMTGQVDFTHKTGTVDAVTTFKDGRPDDTRTIYFTDTSIITGNIPGLSEAMTAINMPQIQYFRADLDQVTKLVDNLVGMLTRLATDVQDDPKSLIANGYTWQGSGTIDGVLTSTYLAGKNGALVSVGVQDKLLHQFASKPVNSDFTATITLSDHGMQTITFPPDDQIANAADFPDIAHQVGA